VSLCVWSRSRSESAVSAETGPLARGRANESGSAAPAGQRLAVRAQREPPAPGEPAGGGAFYTAQHPTPV
jgi:hypothetical protein